MLTPDQLGTKPNVNSIVVPDYDFNLQKRGTGLEMSYTMNSTQTFNNKGQASDARSDQTD
jgi:hypothetical protein